MPYLYNLCPPFHPPPPTQCVDIPDTTLLIHARQIFYLIWQEPLQAATSARKALKHSKMVVHSTVCGSSKFTGTRTCFEKVRVALQRSNTSALHCSKSHVKLTCCKGSTPGACISNRSMGVALCKPVNSQILCMHAHTKQGCGFHVLTDTKI